MPRARDTKECHDNRDRRTQYLFWGYVLLHALLALGGFSTIRLGFLRFRLFPEFFRSVLRTPATDKRGITPIQALCTSLPATVRAS